VGERIEIRETESGIRVEEGKDDEWEVKGVSTKKGGRRGDVAQQWGRRMWKRRVRMGSKNAGEEVDEEGKK